MEPAVRCLCAYYSWSSRSLFSMRRCYASNEWWKLSIKSLSCGRYTADNAASLNTSLARICTSISSPISKSIDRVTLDSGDQAQGYRTRVQPLRPVRIAVCFFLFISSSLFPRLVPVATPACGCEQMCQERHSNAIMQFAPERLIALLPSSFACQWRLFS